MNPLMSLLAEPLALDPRSLPILAELIRMETIEEARSTGLLAAPEDVEVRLLSAETGDPLAAIGTDSRKGSVIAVVPLQGILTRHGMWSPGTSHFARHLRRLDADPAVGTIVLDVDSPGGTVVGTAEASDAVYRVRQRGETQIMAVVDPLMASAATWIATSAQKVYAIGSALTGSIGVMWAYADKSRLLSNLGVDVTVLRTPELKNRFTAIEPLSDAMRSTMEERIKADYQDFIKAMARNRGVSVDDVGSKFGGGEVMGAFEAVDAGLIDGISSMEEVLDKLIEAANSRQMMGRSAAVKRRADLERVAAEVDCDREAEESS